MPQHKRGPWSATEDQYLLHLVQVHGAHNWVRISSAIQTRSPKQCRERFHQNLKPNLNHDPITPEEGILIEQMVAEMGKRWAEIARRLRGRSDNAVKNWWNGGMNRRRRSQNQRRVDPEVQQQPQQPLPQQMPQHHNQHQANMHPVGVVVPPAMHHPGMGHYQAPNAAQYFTQPMYHPAAASMSQHMSVPSNGHMFHRATGLMIEPPLPSPSAYSQLSADGPPSLVSDCSSSSRSPNNGTSPIELPPISGPGSDRRHSSTPMIRLEVPGGGYMQQGDFQMPMQMKQVQQQMQPMLQDAFQPQPTAHQIAQHQAQQQQQHHHQQQQHNTFPQPAQYLPSQPRRPSPHEQVQLQVQQQQHHQFMQAQQQHYQLGQHMLQRDVKSAHPSVPSTPAPMHGLSPMPASSGDLDFKLGMPIDPALQTPTGHHSLTTPDGSPKDKMSLSNLTH